MLELLETLLENHFCEKVYLNKDHNHNHNHNQYFKSISQRSTEPQ